MRAVQLGYEASSYRIDIAEIELGLTPIRS